MNDNDLDPVIARALKRDAAPDPARVLHALANRPLPPQRAASNWWRWPLALLNLDLVLSRPRVAALAGATIIGMAVGLAAPDLLDGGAMPTGDADLGNVVFTDTLTEQAP